MIRSLVWKKERGLEEIARTVGYVTARRSLLLSGLSVSAATVSCKIIPCRSREVSSASSTCRGAWGAAAVVSDHRSRRSLRTSSVAGSKEISGVPQTMRLACSQGRWPARNGISSAIQSRRCWTVADHPPGARYSLLAWLPARGSAGQNCPLRMTNTATLTTETVRSPLHHGFASGTALLTRAENGWPCSSTTTS
jgi:hypothetical protein